jgi:transposase
VVRFWVRQADIDDGYAPGVSNAESKRIYDLDQEIRKFKRANEILKQAASCFGRSSTASKRSSRVHRR